MPLALIIIGLLLIVSGARGTYPQLKELLIKDFTGPRNFWTWIVAIGAVGILGYVPAFEKFSRVFLALVLVVIFLSERGFVAKFQEALQSAGTGGGSSPASTGPSLSSGVGGALNAIDNATGSSLVGGFVSSILGKN